jgi:predicted Zn finger-like uncharacterized protein
MKMKCPHCGVSGSVADSLLGKKVKCPKCKQVFRVEEATVASAPAKESQRGVIIESSGSMTDPAPGLTAQDEAALEQEIAKIFDDMKSSAMNLSGDLKPDAGASKDFGNKTSLSAAGKDEGQGADDAENTSISEDDLISELQEMLSKKCSVCGTFIGQGVKHEVGGNVYCSVCLPDGGGGDDVLAGKDLTVSKKPGVKSTWKEFWKKIWIKFVGVSVIIIVFAALVYQLFLKRA